MKIALISDTHFGVRSDHITFLDNSKLFIDNIFIPYLIQNNISTIIHLGDVVDRRKYSNHQTLFRLRNDFLEKIKDFDNHFIAGNHDVYYKNTNKINALRELGINNYGKIYESKAEIVNFDKTPILFIPWMNDENRKETIETIKNSNTQIAMGHLEIVGFEMQKGMISEHGEDRKIFEKYDMVFSGHFHHRSFDGNIFYLGSHGEFTWSDYNDPRGFHIFDTEKRKIEFIENPYKIFKKIFWNNQDETEDLSEYKNCIVKIITKNKENPYKFESFIEKLETVNPVEIKIIDEPIITDSNIEDHVIDESEPIVSIFEKFIDTVDSKIDKSKIYKKIVELYNEAIALE